MASHQESKVVFVWTTDQAAKFFEINRSTLTRWKKIGADCAYLSRGRWDAIKLHRWWLENIYTGVDESSPDLQAERLRYEKARADKMELEVARMKGELLPRAEVEAALRELIITAKRAFMLIPKKAPGLLVGLSQAEQMEVLQDMVEEILTNLADGATINAIEKKIEKAR